ncbi:N-acetylmuramoyl-L-alanine amidase [Nitrospira lenta]|uniref:N-acetylmuramoyl-L-alanine amidase n=1 Tax=Nitrospira lenta TaxID=1436998 RepID=A0A330L8L3_9BACT|nr:N-acetylmuramoyl-L-alanine amidase [Nitrospira lenta]SPP65599.1 putative N-acetylmuramoyl-L-alanine amidase AmiB [Nitrospira lenta]
MRLRSWQALSFPFSIVSLCLLGLTVVLLTAGVDRALAAASDSRSHRPHKNKAKGTPASMMPATVQNFRVFSTPERTRLVLDLDRHTKVTELRSADSEDVIIGLPHASMSRSAKDRLDRGIIPAPFQISQTTSGTVTVTLPAHAIRRYKQFSLDNPARLVVDVIPGIAVADVSAANQAPPASLSATTFEPPPQPTIPQAKSFKTIVLDPGHGGKDPGARGLRGTEEKDITLKVALRLRDLLSRQPDVRVLMTRDQDVFVELEERAKFANRHEADLFVSIHVNSHPSRSVKGVEVYHFGEAKDQRALEVAARENGTPLSSTGVGWEYLVADLLTAKKIEESLELAWTAKESLVTHMNARYTVTDHGVKTAPFYVLRYTSMPSILAEIAYISNPSEEDLLRKNAFIRDVADSLLNGVKSFLAAGKPTAR